MNLLVLSSWFPHPADNGSRIRAHFLLRELLRFGHKIHLVAGLQTDVAPEESAGSAALHQMGVDEIITAPWFWYDAHKSGTAGKLRAALSPVPRSVLETPNLALKNVIAAQIARKPNAVLVLETGINAYLPAHLPPDIPFILDGAEFTGLFPTRGAKPNLSQKKAAWYGAKQLRRYDAVSVVSHQEAEAAHVLFPAPNAPRIAIIPNGVDAAAYAPRPPSAIEPARLIYNGSPTYGPNRDAVLWLVQNVLPRLQEHEPEARLFVTGRYGKSDAALFAPFGDAVQLTGFVPDIRPEIAKAAICVVPLQQGGGTRLKILEAWASGVPVVSTTIGARGLDGATTGTHFLCADTPADFADAVSRLLREPDLCQALSENARALAASRYDWQKSGAVLNDLIKEVVLRRA